MTPEDPVKQHQAIEYTGEKNVVRDQDKVMLILAYLAPLSLIPLLTVKDSEFVKWHAKQGTVLGIGGTVAMMIIGMIPVLGLITCLLGPAILVLDIMGMIKAINGEKWRIPLVADLADKL